MKIFIPTLGRAGRVRLPETLPETWEVVLVVQPQEYDLYRKHYPDMTIATLPGPLHIGATRKWIIQNCGSKNHIQMDDDVTVRNIVGDGQSIGERLLWLEHELESKAMAGFGRQYMGNQAFEQSRLHYNDRVWHILGINYRAMRNVPVEKFSLYEDTVMNIHALLKGGTVVDYGYLLGNGSYTKDNAGGCSTYRTVDEIQRNMTELFNTYPKWTKIVPSDNLTQGLRVGFTVRTSWSKIKP